MGNPETIIKNKGLVALNKIGRFWNHPTGEAVPMVDARRKCATCGTQPALRQVIRYGFPGSPDTLGVVPITITPDMIGARIGVAVGVEFKTPTGRQREQQVVFEDVFTRNGGVYLIARDAATVAADTLTAVYARLAVAK